jgi:tetratricopeptide (TPR) repeat protein
MQYKKSLRSAALVFLACLSNASNAQLIEDIDFREEAGKTVARFRFVAPVQFQKAIAAKSQDLVQIYYTIRPAADAQDSMSGERRVLKSQGKNALEISDEPLLRDSPNTRRLIVRFTQAMQFKVRAGQTKESIDIVMEGKDALLLSAVAEKVIQPAVGRYVIVLQRSSQPFVPLSVALPGVFQDMELIASRRVADGATVHDTELGYFLRQEDAEKALKELRKSFPAAWVLQVPLAGAAGPADVVAPMATNNETNPDLDANADAFMKQALADEAQGNFPGAIEAMDALLNLPMNSLSRKAQELIGITRLKAGDAKRARGEFENFLKLYPEGADSESIRGYLANLPAAPEPTQKRKNFVEPTTTVYGGLSLFYYGGQSKVQSQEFQDSPLGGLPVLAGQDDLSLTDQSQVQTNLDLNWRYRDSEVDRRFVLRDSYSQDLLPNRPNRNRLSAAYFEQRAVGSGLHFKAGRQSPTGGGVLYRFDGIQAGYTFPSKWKVSAVAGVPTDVLLDAKRSFVGLSMDADTLTSNSSASLYVNQQMIDGEIDRRGLGAELRYFKEGLALSGQLDYDQMLQGLNIASFQGTWQSQNMTMINFLVDRRATPIRTLGNILFFQDPNLQTPARSIQELLGTTPVDMLRTQVNGITSFQTQAMAGFNTPLSANWQVGANVNFTNVDEILPVAVILPNGQPSTGNLWSAGAQLIGSNLYSSRDTHVFSATYITGPTYDGKLLSYNNLSGLTENWQLEPYLRYYTQTDIAGTKASRWTPGIRTSVRIMKQVSLESELSYEVAETQAPLRTESSTRMFYYLGGRFDF